MGCLASCRASVDREDTRKRRSASAVSQDCLCPDRLLFAPFNYAVGALDVMQQFINLILDSRVRWISTDLCRGNETVVVHDHGGNPAPTLDQFFCFVLAEFRLLFHFSEP
jgi:hypothetical protein